jgi:hypothetical protein
MRMNPRANFAKDSDHTESTAIESAISAKNQAMETVGGERPE